MRLSELQSGVLKGILIGALTTTFVLVVAIVTDPFPLNMIALTSDRLAYALKADTLIALWLAISIGRLARHRFSTPDDIDGGGLTEGTAQAKVLQSSLQNTLEQSVLAVLIHLIFAVVAPLSWMSAIPAAAILFFIGRVLFARGYDSGAPARALGFALTFYPSVLMLLLVIAKLLAELLS